MIIIMQTLGPRASTIKKQRNLSQLYFLRIVVTCEPYSVVCCALARKELLTWAVVLVIGCKSVCESIKFIKGHLESTQDRYPVSRCMRKLISVGARSLGSGLTLFVEENRDDLLRTISSPPCLLAAAPFPFFSFLLYH